MRKLGNGQRYGLAVAAVAATLLLKIPLDQAVGRSAPFQLFSLAIVFSAWFGGLGPGLLATVLATAIGSVFSVQVTPGTSAAAVRSAIFLLQGIGISGIGHLLERERTRLARANQRAVDILESVNETFFSLDREWRFTYANRVFEQLAGRRAEDLAGKVYWEVYPHQVGTESDLQYRRAMREQVPVHFTARGNFSGRWYEVHAYPSETGLSVFSTDVTERVRAKEEEERRLVQIQELAHDAQEARGEAERANRLKDQFLATLSHELRTPLNAILGWAQMMRAGRLDAEAMARGLDAIERNARSQAQLIGDLLDVSRITSGKLRLEVRPVDPAAVVDAALATVQPVAEARGVHVERFVDPRMGPVSADPDRLQQVVWNLLSNAVKFTPRDGWVAVHLEAVDGQAVIRIRDTGQGISPDLLPHVFELFRQGDGSEVRGQAGLGIGLSIVRQLVELQGGRVWAESPGEGRGATFSVALPLAAAGPPEGEAEGRTARPDSESPSLPLAGLRLLAVDDEPDTLEVMAELLSLRGAEVVTAASANEALAALQRFDPDVLVSDISMPGRDGYELIREVRTDRGPQELPAVAVTAFAAPEDRRRALSAGFQVHLAKPVDPGELVEVVSKLAARAPGH